MNYISVENLSVSFGDRVLFENLNFGIDKNDKIALIAGNGTGKSTLLKIIGGKETANSGQVTYRDGIRVGFLEQDPLFNPHLSIEETIQQANSKTLHIIKRYHEAVEIQSKEFTAENQKKVEELSQLMDTLHAWDYERRMHEILSKLKVDMLQKKVGELSGGQKKRLALSMVLIDSPDVLLLDEPTNHIDIEMIEWLEEYLKRSGQTVFLVSHDRYFLDNVCNQIIEMEDNTIYHHKGNYVYYLEKSHMRKYIFGTEIEKAQQQYKKELEWMRTQPKARTHKSKSRIESFYEIEKKAKSGTIEKELKLDLKPARIGGKILEMHNIDKCFDKVQVLHNFSYTFKKGDRIGIVGANGSGKTTFLNILTGQLRADAGKIQKGETIKFGYFKQEVPFFDDSKKIIDIVKDIAEDIILSNGKRISASQFLDFFLFPPKLQQTFVSKLSGGEKRRLYLLTVLLQNPNFLILDEPTNDLDLQTLASLEKFLQNFSGCLILVSHDRFFLDTLTDHLFIFQDNGKVIDFYDTYTAYREQQKTQEKNEKPIKTQTKITQKEKTTNPLKPTWKEQNEFGSLELEIEKLEEEKNKLEFQLNNEQNDFEKINILSQQFALIVSQIEEKTARWIVLAEKIDNYTN
jgi:ABC transport system ATP-binding/permease protein